MIVFDLNCAGGHRFEAWFRSSADYEAQLADDEIACPYCGDSSVLKAVTAANVSAKGNQKRSGHRVVTDGTDAGDHGDGVSRMIGMADLPAPLREELAKTLDKVRSHVEKNCDYVGDSFPEEARKIYYGEAEERGIYGEATIEDSMELHEEGIDVMPLPGMKRRRPTDA